MKSKTLVLTGLCTLVILLGIIFFLDAFFSVPALSYESAPLVRDYQQLTYGSNPGAPVTLVEFVDFQCAFCKEMFPTVKQLREDFGDDLNFVQKHIPATKIHPDAWLAAEAAECARDQDKYEEYSELLFEKQHALKARHLKSHAESLSLDMEQFNNCIINREKQSYVQSDVNEAVLHNIRGTPTYFINGKKVEGLQDYAAFKQLIEELINVHETLQ